MLRMVIRAWWALPSAVKAGCPRPGLSCSELAFADGTWAGALGVIRSCGKCSEVPYPTLPKPGG